MKKGPRVPRAVWHDSIPGHESFICYYTAFIIVVIDAFRFLGNILKKVNRLFLFFFHSQTKVKKSLSHVCVRRRELSAAPRCWKLFSSCGSGSLESSCLVHGVFGNSNVVNYKLNLKQLMAVLTWIFYWASTPPDWYSQFPKTSQRREAN